MTKRARPQRPRPETLALAARGRARPASYASICVDMPIEDELIFTRAMAAKLLRLLQLRNPTMADALLADLHIDARATLDRIFEAMLLLFFRHGIDAAPVRRLLWSQDNDPDRFVLTYTNGDYEIVDRARLLQMAGVAGA